MDKIISSQFSSIPTRMIINYIANDNVLNACSKIDGYISKITREIFDIKYNQTKSSSTTDNSSEKITSLRKKILVFNGMRDLVMDQLVIDNKC